MPWNANHFPRSMLHSPPIGRNKSIEIAIRKYHRRIRSSWDSNNTWIYRWRTRAPPPNVSVASLKWHCLRHQEYGYA